ncbi:MAG: GNAT family N-acetyltransferase [Candidatus Zixiibacteriota bacterium]
MTELKNENGITCVRLFVIQEDGEAWAVVVSWKKGVDGVPDSRAFNNAIESCIGECEKSGALYIGSRVVTATRGVDEALTTARAALHRNSLSSHGFKRGEDRVEYCMDLADAITALDRVKSKTELDWNCVDTKNESELERAADLLIRASEGDPASDTGGDALGFLRTMLEENETTQAPERLQIGMYKNEPAAVLALKVYPSDGWATIYYLGVLPVFRRRGFGASAMLQAFNSLKAMGGKIYHDGTASGNTAARALFERLGQPPFRIMEEWILKK